jgi:hypothetical protein
MDHQTRLKIIAPVDYNVAVDLPFDAQLAHPMNRRVGLAHQHVG